MPRNNDNGENPEVIAQPLGYHRSALYQWLKRYAKGGLEGLAYRSKKVQTFVGSTHGRLKLFLLPSYSPELNPDEQVLSQLKHHRLGKMIIKNMDELTAKVQSAPRSFQRTTELIRSFFKHKKYAYTIA